MTVPVPAPVPPAPVAPARPSVFKRVAAALLAAVTSPTAVKEERSLAAFVVGRVLLAAGASYGIEQIVVKIIGG